MLTGNFLIISQSVKSQSQQRYTRGIVFRPITENLESVFFFSTRFRKHLYQALFRFTVSPGEGVGGGGGGEDGLIAG